MDGHSVTIITPTYNAGKYILETVKSVLNQKFAGKFEYIVIDDGSTDDTLEILKPFLDRITLITQKNMGEPSTVNKGVDLAKNDIIGIVNADDPIYPGLITEALAKFTQNSKLVAVYPDWYKIDKDGNIIEEIRTLDYDYNIILEQFCCIPGPGTFFKRSALQGEYPRNAKLPYSSDFDLWVRLGLKGPMARIPKFLATWRYHEEGGSQRARGQQMAQNRIDVMKIFFQRNDLPKTIQIKKKQALSAAYYHAAVLAIHNSMVTGRKFIFKSFWYKYRWPHNTLPRNWRYIVYILGSPITRWCYKTLNFLKNFRRIHNG